MLRRPSATRRALAAATLTVALAACGSDDDDAAVDSTPVTEDTVTDVTLVPATPPPSVPEVSLPASIPTELVVTELAPGEGEPAVEGQIVVVDYVGVRSEDGQQFDTSYGRGPFPVVLGGGRVIAGWEQGLIGSKVGQRLQLDIPADLAYGDSPRGDVIQAGDALTFVVDVRSIVPGDEPTEADIPTSAEAVTEPVIDDVRPGTGATIAKGDQGLFHLVAARGDDGTVLTSSWVDGQAQPLPIDDDELLAGLADGLAGMQVGGRRAITLPYDPESQLTPETNVVIVADLLAIF